MITKDGKNLYFNVDFKISLCRSGGTGRRARLKIWSLVTEVRVRFPPPADLATDSTDFILKREKKLDK